MDTKLALTAVSAKPGCERDRDKRKANAERDLHRKFAALGLSLPVNIEEIVHEIETGAVTTHWVKPSTWLRVLLSKNPESLFGEGLAKENCSAFWALYRHQEPDHEVFNIRTEEQLSRTIPLCVYGDEGRGPKRGVFLIYTIESPIGVAKYANTPCECECEIGRMPSMDLPSDEVVQDLDAALLKHASEQSTNYKQHSFTTRHLLFGVPHWLYCKNRNVIDEHVLLMTRDLMELLQTGFMFEGLWLLRIFSQ